MPELPEVETIRRGLIKKVKGLEIKDVRIIWPKVLNCSAAEFKRAVIGAKIKDIKRRGKILIFRLSNGNSLLIHLKLTGQLIYNGQMEKHTRAIFTFGNNSQIIYNDLRKFGYIKLVSENQLRKVLKQESFGPEPLDSSFTLSKFRELIRSKRKGKVKPLLVNQKFIAGLGNIYADEVLFYASVHPERNVDTLTEDEIKKIHRGIRKILSEALNLKGSSVDTYVDAEGKEGGYVPFLKVYGQEGELCFRCETPIKRIKMGSRSAYFCPRCQR